MENKFILKTEDEDIFILQDINENKIGMTREELFSLYCEIEDMLEEERAEGF